MNAYVEETGMNLLQARQALIDDFMAKGPDSVNRMNTINTFNENNFNQTLVGVSDPTHLIQIRMEFRMDGNIAMPCMAWTILPQSITGLQTH